MTNLEVKDKEVLVKEVISEAVLDVDQIIQIIGQIERQWNVKIIIMKG